MGKAKHTHRSEKKTVVNEDEERRKMRESILRIFHERAQSPEGAVLVSEGFSCPQQLHRDQKTVDLSSSDSQPDNQLQTRKRKRRKKVMTGRGGSKHNNKTTVSQHVKSAHTYSYIRPEAESQTRSGSASGQRQDVGGRITWNRLTRGVGLFNPGKKSKTVYRELLPVPESVQRDVEKTLKQILAKDDKEQRSHRQFDASGTDSIPQTEAERVGCHRGASTPPPGTVHPDRASKESSTVCSPSPSAPNPESVTLHSRDVSPVEPFPKVVPYQEIAAGMLSFLDTQSKKTFKNQDLLTETCQELKKLLQQNQSTPEASRTGDGLGVQTTTGNTSVRRSLLNSFSQGNSGANQSSISQQRPRSVEMPAHHACFSSTSTCRHTLSSNHPAHSVHASPRSAVSGSRSAPRLSYPDFHGVASHSGLPLGESGKDCHLINKSAFLLPPVEEPCLMLGSHSVIPSNQSEHSRPLTSTGDNRRNSEVSTDCGPFAQTINLSAARERCDRRERSGAARGSAVRKGDDCDMELNPQMVDVSKGLTLNESALELLRCNHFISRVSSLCGETEASPEDDGAPEIRLHRCARTPSFSASSHLRGTHAALTHRGDNAAILCREDDTDQVKESNACLLKALGQSPVQTPSEPYFKLFGHHRQQARAQVSEDRSDQDYFRSQWSVPDLAFGMFERRDSTAAYHITGATARNTRSHRHQQDMMDPFSHHSRQQDVIDTFSRHSRQQDVMDTFSRHSHQQDVMDTFSLHSHQQDVMDGDPEFFCHCPSDLLDQLDIFPHHHFQRCNWHRRWPSQGDGVDDTDSQPQDDEEWLGAWDQSNDILPPLRKPSLDTPSPPQKLSPHKLY